MPQTAAILPQRDLTSPCARGIRTSLCSTEQLGHADVRTTQIYTHVLQRGGRAVGSPLGAVLGRTPT
jgi:hypothetical protein